MQRSIPGMPPSKPLSKTQRKKRQAAARKEQYQQKLRVDAAIKRRDEKVARVKAERAKAAALLPTDPTERKEILTRIFNKHTRGVKTRLVDAQHVLSGIARGGDIATKAMFEALDLGFSEAEARTVSQPIFQRFVNDN